MHHPDKPASGRPLTDLLFSLSPNWLYLLLNVSRNLYGWLRRRQPEGLYEFLEYDADLDLLDPSGQTAIFHKRERVRFLQNHIIAFEDFAWGDGQIFADYKVSPGVIADRYRDGDRWNVLISLRETKRKGDVEEFHIRRTVHNGFMQAKEWRQTEVRHPVRRLRLSVTFPARRHCRRASLLQRSYRRTIELGPEHFHKLADGRQMVRWETQNVLHYEVYTLQWEW